MRRSLDLLLRSRGLAPQSFSSAGDFLARVGLLRAGPLLLDVRMPDVDGLSLMQKLTEQNVLWPAIVMTGHGNVPIAVKAMKFGAIEFLEKPFNSDSLYCAIDLAFHIMREGDRSRKQRDHARKRFDRLTKREREVVGGMVGGLSNKANAHSLGVSVRTVEMHRRNAMQKLGLQSIADLVRLTNDLRSEFAPMPGRPLASFVS